MKVLILGNGKSRLKLNSQISSFEGDLWVCNRAYTEYKDFKRKIDLVGSVHPNEAEKAYIFKLNEDLNYEIVTNFAPNTDIKEFKKYRGWSTGTQLISEAIDRGYKEIYLAGFCFINNDEECIYTQNLVTQNFRKQWDQIIDSNPKCKFIFIK